MKTFIFTLMVFCFSTFAFAQQPSGNEGKKGWTSDHELMYRQADAINYQRMQKKAKKEALTNPNGPHNRALRDRQTTDYLGKLFRIGR